MALMPLEATGGASAHRHARLDALCRAALRVQEALTPEAVLAEVGVQLSALGFGWQHAHLIENGAAAVVESVSLAPTLIAAAERLLGIRALGFRLPVADVRTLHAAIYERRTVFVEGAAVLAEVFPAAPPGVVRQLIGLLGAQQILITPLVARGQVIGTLSLWGNDLTPADVPAVAFFAQQVATAHENARVYQQAQATRERYEALLRTAPDAIVVADEDGRVVLVNGRAEALFGYADDELVGEPAARLAPQRLGPAHAEREPQPADASTPATSGTTPAVYARRKDGSEFPVEITLGHHQAAGQRFTTAIIRDLTERQQADTARYEARLLEAQLEGILLAAREMGHLLNNDLALPVVALDLLRQQRTVPADLRTMIEDAAVGLAAAEEHVRQLQQVVRVAIKPTPVGPALDLERSADADRRP